MVVFVTPEVEAFHICSASTLGCQQLTRASLGAGTINWWSITIPENGEGVGSKSHQLNKASLQKGTPFEIACFLASSKGLLYINKVCFIDVVQ